MAGALVEFETLWHGQWVASVDAARAGLSSTLIVRHPETGALLVNFDRDVAQLLRETRCLQSMGVPVPEAARMVLLQEDKFKRVHSQLTHVIKEHDRIMASVLPVAFPLLRPHLEDLEKRILPGITTLTWTSLNIDTYLQRIYAGLGALEELVRKINDVIDNRVESNLRAVSATRLVDMPRDKSFTFDDFVAHQGAVIKARPRWGGIGGVRNERVLTHTSPPHPNLRQARTAELLVRNQEVQRAVADLLTIVRTFPRDNPEVQLGDAEVAAFTRHYSRLIYLAIRAATRASLGVMKARLARRASAAFVPERPLFDVELELAVPVVALRPSLEDIQSTVNAIAKRVLRASLELPLWSSDGGGSLGGGAAAADVAPEAEAEAAPEPAAEEEAPPPAPAAKDDGRHRNSTASSVAVHGTRRRGSVGSEVGSVVGGRAASVAPTLPPTASSPRARLGSAVEEAPAPAPVPEGEAESVAAETPRWRTLRQHFAAGGGTFFDLIARDHEIVKAVLLLTGCVEAAKTDVLDFVCVARLRCAAPPAVHPLAVAAALTPPSNAAPFLAL